MLLTVHHVAASGGSIVSQVLAAATNSVLISEINPLGSIHGCRGLKPHYDPTSLLWHLAYNSEDLSPKLKLRYFFGQLDISIEHFYSIAEKFRNKKTKEVYDMVMSYEDLLKYRKKRNIEQVFQPYKVFRLNDMGGPEDSFREWCLQDSKDIDTSKSFNFRNSKEEYLFGNEEDK